MKLVRVKIKAKSSLIDVISSKQNFSILNNFIFPDIFWKDIRDPWVSPAPSLGATVFEEICI